MNVKIKKLNTAAVIPKYANPNDAGLDLTATSCEYNNSTSTWDYGTGLAFAIPKGYVGLLFPRSSVCKTDLTLANSVGVIDAGYRGEVMLKFKAGGLHGGKYKVGERVGQILIIPYPEIQLEEVEELDETKRGEGGFGSSGAW